MFTTAYHTVAQKHVGNTSTRSTEGPSWHRRFSTTASDVSRRLNEGLSLEKHSRGRQHWTHDSKHIVREPQSEKAILSNVKLW